MHFIKLALFMMGLSVQVYAEQYTNKHLSEIIDHQAHAVTSDFIRGFFTANHPQLYLQNFINNKQPTNHVNALVKEFQLYSLLNDIALLPKQPFLQQAVDELKRYDIRAMKKHDEGQILMPVYDINNRAKGIENIWRSQQFFSDYVVGFNHRPIETLTLLKHHMNSMTPPEWLGVKKSLSNVTDQNHQRIRDFLLKNPQQLADLSRFIGHYALFTEDQRLIVMALNHIDVTDAEYLLRNLSTVFSDDFAIDALIMSMQKRGLQKFAMSMMANYVDISDKVRAELLVALSDHRLADQAAFALSQTRRDDVIQRLYQQFINSQTTHEKNASLLAMKLNNSRQAQDMIKNIEKIEISESNRMWLNNFKGAKQ